MMITALFFCLTVIVQTVLCLFYAQLSKQAWSAKKKFESLYYAAMAVITLTAAGFCMFAMLDLLGLIL